MNDSIHFLSVVRWKAVVAEKSNRNEISCTQIIRLQEMLVEGVGLEFHPYSSTGNPSHPIFDDLRFGDTILSPLFRNRLIRPTIIGL